MEKLTIDISWASLFRVLFFLILAIILFLGREILLGLFLAIVISAGLEAAVNYLEKKGLPRALGVVIIFLLVVIAFIFLLYTLIPFLVLEISKILTDFQRITGSLGVENVLTIEEASSFKQFIEQLSSKLLNQAVIPLEFIFQILGGAGLFITVVVVSFYLSISKDGIERLILTIFPKQYEQTALTIYQRAVNRVGRWLRTQLFLSLIIGLLVWFGLYLLGVKYSLVLGLIAAILELVPYVGPILAGAVATLIALSESIYLAFYTILVFLIIQYLENHMLIPLLMRKAVGLHPVVVIISLLIGFRAGGILGMIVAVPAASVLQEIIEYWSERKQEVVPLENQ